MPKIPPPKPSNIPTTTRKPKLWAVIIGVNQYQDADIDDLDFCANDAMGLAAALHEVALQQAANREAVFDMVEIRVHCDRFNSSSVNSISLPTASNIFASLDLFSQAQPQDTVLFYFSGHGFHDRSTKNTILCLPTTERNALSNTGLAIADVVKAINNSPAKQQLIWLDACHSGGMASQLIEGILAATKANPQIYAITACDRDEESLELPQLGHGLFTYNLIQGLQGSVTNSVIKTEDLYQYVYYKTLEYIDRTNQLFTTLNQDSDLKNKYELLTSFTPQRFAFGSGEFKLGLHSFPSDETKRGTLVIDGVNPSPMALNLSNSLANKGKFLYQPYSNRNESLKDSIAALLRSPDAITVFLYLKGKFEITEDLGIFHLDDGSIIPQEWLARQIANSPCPQQVIIFDCSQTANINEQIETFKQPNKSQCIVAASTEDNWLGQKLIEIIDRNSAEGLTATNLIDQCSKALALKGIFKSKQRSFYRSAPQGDIISVIYPQGEQTNNIVIDRNYCPYKGLEAFTPQDKDYFFGRENLIRDIIAQLETSSFVPVVGASGSGKSSVVHGGIVPILLKPGIFSLEDNLYHSCQVWTLRPGENPFRALALAFSDKNITPDYLEGILNLGIPSFVAWLRQHPQPMGILIIDQFEELFTQASEVRRSLFIDLILGAVERAGDRFKVIITLRSDFMASCLSLPQLGEKVKQNPIFVPSYLTETEYQQIITHPAKRVGLSVQPELVDVLISEVSQEKGALPLLEFTLEQLWLNRDRGYLSLKAYQEKIGGIKKVLQERADEIYQKLTKPQQECAEWIFTQLVSLGEGQEDTRRRRNLSELIVPKYPQELITSTLNILRDSRLIVMSDRDGDIITSQQAQGKTKGANQAESKPLQLSPDSEITVEIAHEILIRNWQQLRWWLDENREQIRLRERVEAKATEWKINGEKLDYLIRGAALAQAEEFYIKSADELSAKSQEFIYQSIEDRDKQAKLAKRRRRQIIGSLTGGIVTLSMIAGTALWQLRRATISEINALNNSAEALSVSDRQFDALIAGLKARKKMQNSWLGFGNNQNTRIQTLGTLQNVLSQIKEFNRLENHTNDVYIVRFSPDGHTVASASRDGTIKLSNLQGRLLTTMTDKTPIKEMKFSPDGKIIASVSGDKTVKLWNLQGQLLHTLSSHTNFVEHLEFSPDGRIVASASRDGTVKLWNLQGQLLHTLSSHNQAVWQVKFSPGGNTLASASSDNTIKLWNLQGQLLHTLSGHTKFIKHLEFNREGNVILSASSDNTIKSWNVDEGTLRHSFTDHTNEVNYIEFSPDGNIMASASSDNTVKLWSRKDRMPTTLTGHQSAVWQVKFSPDGNTIASAGFDGEIKIWTSNGYLLTTLTGHYANINHVEFSPDGKIVASASSDGTVRLWNLENQLLPSIDGHNGAVNQISFSPDGRFIASAGFDGTIKLSTPNGQLLRSFDGHERNANHITFSPNGKLIVSSSNDGKIGTIKLWDLEGKLLHTFVEPSPVTTIKFSPDSKIIASGSWDKTIKLWNLETQSATALAGHNSKIDHIAFSPNGQIIASGSWDKTIKLWNLKTQSTTTLTEHKGIIDHIAFSPDGKTIASGSSDSTVKLWNLEGQLLHTLKGHTQPVYHLRFSPDGKTIASASQDNTVKLWNLQGQFLYTLKDHNLTVKQVKFSPDGQIIASGSNDTTIKLWNLKGELLTTLKGHKGFIEQIEFSHDSQTIASVGLHGQDAVKLWHLDFDYVLARGCDWVRDYLTNNPNVSEEDKKICEGIE